MKVSELKVLRDQVRQRLQALLAERFHLLVRRETREMPVYALEVAKNGPKLEEGPVEGPHSMRGERGQMIAENAPIQLLAINLSQHIGRPVLDRTGLTKAYNFKLEYSPEPGGAGLKALAGPGDKAEGATAPELSGPSIFTAVQEARARERAGGVKSRLNSYPATQLRTPPKALTVIPLPRWGEGNRSLPGFLSPPCLLSEKS